MNELLWTRRSLRDVESIFNYISQEREESARTVVSRIQKSVQSLAFHPFMGREGRKPGTRELVVLKTPYVVVYRVKEGQTQILRVLHGAQRYP